MKRKNNFWLYVIFFLFGALISYLFSRYKFLEIDKKVNVTTSLISVISAMIALYLAISLKKNQTQSSNLHSYLQPKLDVVWKLFLNLSHNLNLTDNIEVSEVTKSIKEILQNITPLKKMFDTFKVSDNGIKNIEIAIEDLEKFLVDECEISGNIITFKDKKDELRAKLDSIHSLIAFSLKTINKIT